jgi:uncharacterized membrane protein YeaQ/YmgE (transglycosylase-associated protein family)
VVTTLLKLNCISKISLARARAIFSRHRNVFLRQEFFGKEDGMHLLTWILVGAAIGWGTGKAIHGNGYGPFRDVVLGMGGGVVGGFLMNTHSVGGYSGTILTTMVAMIGAVLLTMLAGFTERRKVYARAI